MVVYQGHSVNGSSSGSNTRSGKQQMEYVLLPRLSQLLYAAQPQSIQSTRSNHNANELHSPTTACPSTSTGVHDTSDNDALVSMSLNDDGFSVEHTSDSDYIEPGGNAHSNGTLDEDLFVESVGGKRSRDDEDNDDYSSSESGILSKARRPKRRRALLTHNSEQDDSGDEGEFSTIPGPSSLKPERSTKPSASTEVIRKKMEHKPREKHNVRKWTNIMSRVTIIEEGDVIKFTFGGHECTHSSGFASDFSSESDSFLKNDGSSVDFDHSCAALQGFNMCFYRPLNMVFCKTHKKCIPLGSLKSHISSSAQVERHSYTLPRIRKGNAIEIFLSHIALSFNLPYDQTFHSQGADIKQLPKPIPNIEEPRIYLQCPECEMWLCQSDERRWKSPTVRLHLKRNSKCAQLLQIPESERPALKECYGQRPCGTGGIGPEMRVPLIEIIGWSPTSSEMPPSIEEAESPMKSVDPSSQEYAKSLKWYELVPQETAECIQLLCRLPNPSRSNASTSADPMSHQNRANILERGLHEVHTFLQKYLEEANDFVDSCDDGLRLNLTEGLVLKCPVVL